MVILLRECAQNSGAEFHAKAVVLTAGTFLNGLLHIGRVHYSGGRMGDEASFLLSDQISSLGVSMDRMKTGTPVRIDGRTIDFSKLEPQDGNIEGHQFSYGHPSIAPSNNSLATSLTPILRFTTFSAPALPILPYIMAPSKA